VTIKRTILAVLICAAGHTSCQAYQATEEGKSSSTPDLSQMSLEELTKIEVSSVSRKDQQLFRTPAAVYVITREDIAMSGVSSLPELLRSVPGMQVAQVYANEWAVSARGFNGRFADKILVLIDGRSVYSEIYSGVFWDQNDLALGDIDRIEVIRGPGGTLWGANAVNGIINIITSKASQTVGTQIDGEAGRIDNAATGRYGGYLGHTGQYRAYLKDLYRNALVTDEGTSAHDSGHTLRGGARMDWRKGAADNFSLHGDLYHGNEGQTVVALASPVPAAVPDTIKTSGGYALGRWQHTFDGSDLAFQIYYNQEQHGELAGNGRERALDFDFQHHLHSISGHDIIYGLGFRRTTDYIFGSFIPFQHDRHRDNLYSLFVQDDYSVVPDVLVLTGGIKVQNNSYTGMELQPSVRGIWTPDARHALWLATSRAVRTPSVQDLDLRFPQTIPSTTGLPTQLLALGNPAFHSEDLLAYEAGYRQQLDRRASIDIAAFDNRYTKLRSEDLLSPYVTPGMPPLLTIPVMYGNGMDAHTRGAETALLWTPTRTLTLRSSYAWINEKRSMTNGQPTSSGDSWSTPTNTLNQRATWQVSRDWSLYSSFYMPTALERMGNNGIPPVRRYERVDTHVIFHPLESLSIMAGGDNLLDARHPEFDPEDNYSVRSQIPRSAFLKATWTF
jgi:iron complex outermembrane receptor protein